MAATPAPANSPTGWSYQPLKGKGYRFGAAISANRLYLGPDHLLSVDGGRYLERYRRFYFRDIQAIVVRETAGQTTWMLIWLLPGIFGLFIFALLSWLVSPGFIVGAAVWSFFFGALLLRNFILGKRCQTYLRTAVQHEELPALDRLKTALPALARLRPLILQAQGEIPPAELPRQLEALQTALRAGQVLRPGTVPRASTLQIIQPEQALRPASTGLEASTETGPAQITPAPSTEYRSPALFHSILGGTLLGSSGILLTEAGTGLARHPFTTLAVLSVLAIVLTFGVAVTACARQVLAGDSLRAGVKVLAWIAAGLLLVNLITGYCYFVGSQIASQLAHVKDGARPASITIEQFDRMAQGPGFRYVEIGFGVIEAGLAAGLLLMLPRGANEEDETAEIPPAPGAGTGPVPPA